MTMPLPRLRTVALVLALGAVALLGAGPAVAHEAAPTVRAVIDAVAPRITGLEVTLAVSVATQIDVTNSGPDPIVFLDPEGRPFLRVSRGGVEADVGLASWYLLNDPAGRVPDDGRVRDDADAGPVWTPIANTNSWGWFDHRIHPGLVAVPAEVGEAEGSVDLAEWSIPFVVGEGTTLQDGEVRGRIVHAPQRGTFRTDLVGALPADVEVGVLQGRVPGLFIRNTSGRDLVIDHDQTPFLRFLADGRVQANERSPRWWDHARTSTATPLPAVAEDAGAEPAWVDVATSGTFSVLLPAAAYDLAEPVERLGEEQTVAAATLLVAGPDDPQPIEVQTTWVPSDDRAPEDCLPSPGCLRWVDVVAATGGIAVVAALIGVRRTQAARRDR